MPGVVSCQESRLSTKHYYKLHNASPMSMHVRPEKSVIYNINAFEIIDCANITRCKINAFMLIPRNFAKGLCEVKKIPKIQIKIG